jgi:hypothetical protein
MPRDTFGFAKWDVAVVPFFIRIICVAPRPIGLAIWIAAVVGIFTGANGVRVRGLRAPKLAKRA